MKKYDVIMVDIEQRIRDGRLIPGQKLPSVRDAAASFGCSAGTVVRAYGELERRHVLYSMPQSGFYVVDRLGDGRDDREESVIDFATVLPDRDAFPYMDFQHCLNKAIDIYKHDLFTYGDLMGLASLRHTLVSHLAGDQVFAKAGQIVVTSGAQKSLEILARMPFPNGKGAVLVEQPSYGLYLRFLERAGIPVSGIARTAVGIDLKELERCFRSGEFKYFYTMPRYHNPLGTSYNAETRKRIVRLADKYDVYIVEDDYMGDLGNDRQFDPIYAHDLSAHVIYVKSFSKIIFPGLRLGVAVLPEHLLPAFRAHQGYPDTSLLSQAALEVYIKNGMYERHKHKICQLYASRMQALNEAVERYNTAGLVETSEVSSGIFIQFKVQQSVNMDQLIKRLSARGVRVVAGQTSYLTGYREREKFLRISISQTSPDRIVEGVRVVLEEVARGSRGQFRSAGAAEAPDHLSGQSS
ncbi:PLP-dependent aminotransferase family protein [Paenibacillus sp. 1P07SE]|uniref:aminotransferase-like domain-containing protein n=1 Tax=Paenibacillus sp. 1P07SE TaxID=3132209 RepID=UPI0039A777B3